MSKYGRYFTSDSNWNQFCKAHPEYALKTDPHQVLHLNIEADRTQQTIDESKWTAEHPLETFGYRSRLEQVKARDGHPIGIKIYHPLNSTPGLPLLFVTHGGGWVQGTHVTEEAWLLYPIFQNFQFVVVSVDYRLAPESKYPTYVDDSWDTLEEILRKGEELGFDPDRAYVAGSSAGGCLAATMTQKALQAGLPIKGAILNVPITCHPKHFPSDTYEYTSYDQCFGAKTSSVLMRQIWDKVMLDPEDGRSPQASPLLGEVRGLPPHLIFIAGQDPLRDEGLAYAEKLEKAGVKTRLHIYQGVPHTFAEIWELEMTENFRNDLIAGVRELVG